MNIKILNILINWVYSFNIRIYKIINDLKFLNQHDETKEDKEMHIELWSKFKELYDQNNTSRTIL